MDTLMLADQQKLEFNSSMQTLEDLQRAMADREGWQKIESKESVLSKSPDDDVDDNDGDLYISSNKMLAILINLSVQSL